MKPTKQIQASSSHTGRWLPPLLVACAAILGACEGDGNGDDKPLTDDLTPQGEFSELAVCPFGGTTNSSVTCGTLRVPEDYTKSTGRQLELAVAIFKSQSKTPAQDPVVYLAGGPGGSGLDEVQGLEALLAPVLARRDVIAIDQRGTGHSKPLLSCAALDMVSDESKLVPEAVACRDRLKAQGIDLAQYTTANNARDVRALRNALGIRLWNALGVSYGTRLGLELMRQGPDGLRAVVLDSTLPPDLDALAEGPAAFERSIEHMFDTCAADAACTVDHPQLEKRFYALLTKLDKAPLEGHDSNGKTVTLRSTEFVNLMHELAYDVDAIRFIPAIVGEAETGSTGILEDFALLDEDTSGFASGMHLSIACAEWTPLTSEVQIASALDGVQPEIAKALAATAYLMVCPIWQVPSAAKEEFTPVRSDLPTLVLAGAYDPATPPAWGEHVAKTLSNSHYSLFQGASHGVIGSECGAQMVADFLDAPDDIADPSCAEHDAPISWTPGDL